MNSKIRKTLAAVFHDPVRSDINWSEIEMLFISLGAEVRAEAQG
jgi:hypothetical protein